MSQILWGATLIHQARDPSMYRNISVRWLHISNALLTVEFQQRKCLCSCPKGVLP
jgi:hypothetical protein